MHKMMQLTWLVTAPSSPKRVLLEDEQHRGDEEATDRGAGCNLAKVSVTSGMLKMGRVGIWAAASQALPLNLPLGLVPFALPHYCMIVAPVRRPLVGMSALTPSENLQPRSRQSSCKVLIARLGAYLASYG
jgi:hypothetical protein